MEFAYKDFDFHLIFVLAHFILGVLNYSDKKFHLSEKAPGEENSSRSFYY